MTNLLLASKWFNGAFVFLLGMIVVFFGITVIVLVISGIGKVMSAKKSAPKQEVEEETPVERQDEQIYDGASPEVVAAITAVLSAYYFSNESNCEFKIKKIKRIY